MLHHVLQELHQLVLRVEKRLVGLELKGRVPKVLFWDRMDSPKIKKSLIFGRFFGC